MKAKNNRRRLTLAQAMELEEIRVNKRMSYRALHAWMEAPFTVETLRAALLGRALWKPNYEFLVRFLRQLHAEEKPDVAVRT